MKIMYQIVQDWTDSQIELLLRHGIKQKKGLNALQIEESKYLELKSYIDKWETTVFRYPDFTLRERQESKLSAKSGHHTHGYPMPDMDFGYLDLTYNLDDYCKTCGIGKKQKDAFRLKNVPSKGKKRIFSIGWVFDELFVEKDLYDEVFRPLGIGSREILKFKKDSPFEDRVQLVVPKTKENLVIENNQIENCNDCKRWKYQPAPEGFYPQYNNIVAPLFKTKEWFGSGSEARNLIFMERNLREKLIEMKIEKPRWYIPTR